MQKFSKVTLLDAWHVRLLALKGPCIFYAAIEANSLLHCHMKQSKQNPAQPQALAERPPFTCGIPVCDDKHITLGQHTHHSFWHG